MRGLSGSTFACIQPTYLCKELPLNECVLNRECNSVKTQFLTFEVGDMMVTIADLCSVEKDKLCVNLFSFV